MSASFMKKFNYIYIWKNRSSWPPSADFCWSQYLLNNQQNEVVRLHRRRLVKASVFSSYY